MKVLPGGFGAQVGRLKLDVSYEPVGFQNEVIAGVIDLVLEPK